LLPKTASLYPERANFFAGNGLKACPHLFPKPAILLPFRSTLLPFQAILLPETATLSPETGVDMPLKSMISASGFS